jgi:hypothetical protein
MTEYFPFYLDNKKFMTNQKCFIITGDKLYFLTAFLNSKLFRFCFSNNFPTLGEKGRELSKIFFIKIPVLLPTNEIEFIFKEEFSHIAQLKNITDSDIKKIDTMIFDIYKLSTEEINYIESI